MTEILLVRKAGPDVAEAMERLLPQLAEGLEVSATEILERLVASPTTALFCAVREARIVGMLALAWYDVPSGRHAWIEDVVVDAAFRGSGIGTELVRAAQDYAVRIGVDKVSLTSAAWRTAAHILYRKVGFGPYDTVVFRQNIKKKTTDDE